MDDPSLNQKLYDRLIDVVGTMEDIRKRQDLFKCMDIVNGFGDIDSISISAGSLTEGLNLKGSDEDMMLVLKNINVVPENEMISRKENEVQVSMRLVEGRGGYASLYLSDDEQTVVKDKSNAGRNEVLSIRRSLELSGERCIVSSARFRGQFIVPGNTSHGPCVTDGTFDFAISVSGCVWPKPARDRILNCRSKRWLTKELTDQILSDRCIYVPIGPKHFYSGTLWRVSFALAEKRLIHAMTHIQMLCYGLLKIVLKEGIADRLPGGREVLCSYFMKTCMFWLIEETDNDEEFWRKDRLYICFLKCLDKLSEWVETGNCPNYISPTNNMFIGKVTENNKSDVIDIISKFRNGGSAVLENCPSLGQFMTTEGIVTDAEREANLDFLFFRVLHIYPLDEREFLQTALTGLKKSQTASDGQPFMKEILWILITSLYKGLAQMIDPTAAETEDDRLQEMQTQKECLEKGIGTGQISGQILMASYHHRNGDNQAPQEILQDVVQRLKPEHGMMVRRRPEYTSKEIQNYTKEYCGRNLGLQAKMEAVTVSTIILYDNSTVLPKEFQPEVRNYRPLFMAPAAVFAHALLFLCNHHMGNTEKAKEALSFLVNIIDTRYLILASDYSNACTMTGVCFETFGDFSNAEKYYLLAKNAKPTCRSVKCRIENLNKVCVGQCNA